MPIITQRIDYNGFQTKVDRLGLRTLVTEVENVVTGFNLAIAETKHANGTKVIRERFDLGFERCGGWIKIVSGGVDWSKENDRRSKLGVEVQVSGRSDLLAVDVIHLKDELDGGRLDAGIIIVPDDELSHFLTDRTPNLRTAIRHIQSRAPNMAVEIIAFRHNAIGPPLEKARTNLGA